MYPLGPILFLLFINDLPSLSNIFKTILFADDAKFSLSGDNPTNMINIANRELDKFYHWCVSNRLTINTIKTYCILFSKSAPSLLPPLVIRSGLSYEVIQRVADLKFLGVYYDQKLTFNRHITFISNRLASISSLIYRVKHIVPQYVLKKMYDAHVCSLLSYCNIIWANTYECHLKPLNLILKRIIRNIARTDFLAHTKPLFKQLRILDVENTRKLALAKYFFANREEITRIHTADHQYPTRHRHRLRPAAHNLTLFEKSFLYQAPRLWNELNPRLNLGNLDDITPTQFKVKVKKLFRDI